MGDRNQRPSRPSSTSLMPTTKCALENCEITSQFHTLPNERTHRVAEFQEAIGDYIIDIKSASKIEDNHNSNM